MSSLVRSESLPIKADSVDGQQVIAMENDFHSARRCEPGRPQPAADARHRVDRLPRPVRRSGGRLFRRPRPPQVGQSAWLPGTRLDTEYRTIVLHHSVETEGSCSGSQLLQDGVQLFASCGDINLQSKEECSGEDCSKQVKITYFNV